MPTYLGGYATIALLLLSLGFGETALADDTADKQSIESEHLKNVTITRQGSELRLQVAGGASEVWIPRFFSSIVSVHWAEYLNDDPKANASAAPITVTPEPDYWRLTWDPAKGTTTQTITMKFDGPPLLASEVAPIKSLGDGRFRLTANMAVTKGEKVRYEPQPHKNTVGYWVGKKDQATWTIQVDEPGEFNIGILQGCGKGQGGSAAVIEITSKGIDRVQSLDFTVEETGHFQDFRWRHLGSVRIQRPGIHNVTVRPTKIAKTALMDVREIQLIRLPSAKR